MNLARLPSLLLALALTAPAASAQVDRVTGRAFATRSEVLARHGMVCTSVAAATQAGLNILQRGGNAVDAAIAANAVLGLMDPFPTASAATCSPSFTTPKRINFTA